MAIAPFEEWRVDFLRFSVFTSESTFSIELLEHWWKVISPSGDLADISSKPKTHEHILTGTFEDYCLELRTVQGRIDVFLKVAEGSQDEEQIGCGVYRELVDPFIQSIQRWLKIELSNSMIITRIAFGTVILLPVPSVSVGYENLKILLPFVALEPDWSDFFFQINRPRSVQIDGFGNLKLNYVTKHAVGTLNRMIIKEESVGTNLFHFNHVEVDCNTDAENTTSLSAQLEQITKEITKLKL